MPTNYLQKHKKKIYGMLQTQLSNTIRLATKSWLLSKNDHNKSPNIWDMRH